MTKNIGKYPILETLGAGGFGTVYLAHHPDLNRKVALKVLKATLLEDVEFVERFRREVNIAAGLRHPNIVTVIDAGEADGYHFMVMDYVEGQDLYKVIQAEAPLTVKRVADVLTQVAEALDYAHSEGLIHRDVKPPNILIGKNDKAFLSDFGIVRAVNTGATSVTTTGLQMGTVEYMAPEQIISGQLGAYTDTYALGIVAYQMLTGRTPFADPTPFNVQMGHVQKQPPDPRQYNAALGEHTVAVLEKALAKDPAARYQSGKDLAEALHHAAEKEEDKYWAELYDQAIQLEKEQKLADALDKWNILLKGRPNYRDAVERLKQLEQRIKLNEELNNLLGDYARWRSQAEFFLENVGTLAPRQPLDELLKPKVLVKETVREVIKGRFLLPSSGILIGAGGALLFCAIFISQNFVNNVMILSCPGISILLLGAIILLGLLVKK